MKVHDESINTHGFWVRTKGWLNKKDFEANPIMLFNHSSHWRGEKTEVLPIGYWDEIEVKDNGEIWAVPVIDIEDEGFAKEVGGKVERNVIRAASIGIRYITFSDNPQNLKKGQRRPTVWEWEMREISLADIPSNKRAVMLYDHEGERIDLSEDAKCPLPLLELKNKNQKSNIPKMEDKLPIIAGFLGLAATASLADVQDAITQLKDKAKKVAGLQGRLADFEKKEKDAQKELAIGLVDAADKDGRITKAEKAMYLNLFEKDFEGTRALLAAQQKTVGLADVPDDGKKKDGDPGVLKYKGKTFSELRKEEGALAKLKDTDPEAFKALFKSEYGKEYKG